jgi:hypothetical protein
MDALGLLYTPSSTGHVMARSDSFFIRAKLSALTGGAGGFTTEAIDLGSFVDALGKTVMRIHNVSVQYTYGANLAPLIAGGNDEGITSWQITTQNQTGMVDADNRTLISSGALVASNSSAVGNTVTFVGQDIDVSPQKWENGYLIAVESIQLAGQSSASFTDTCDVSVVLECTVETMTAAASMALALSQQ